MEQLKLQVADRKIQQYADKGSVDALAELIWNALDANANLVTVSLRRNPMEGIAEVIVQDDGDGISAERAATSFTQYGDSWKAQRRHTDGGRRILHGRKGEGRLYAFALGDRIRWTSFSAPGPIGVPTSLTIDVDAARPTIWQVAMSTAASDTATGTTVTIQVPQSKTLSALDKPGTADDLLARLAPYLLAYPDVRVEFEGRHLDAKKAVRQRRRLDLDLPLEYCSDDPPPSVEIIEWKSKRSKERGLLVCSAGGAAIADLGSTYRYPDSVVAFTPYLRTDIFAQVSAEDLHMLPMTHDTLLSAADAVIQEYIVERRSAVASQVVAQLKAEKIYPYPEGLEESEAKRVERKTFDLVVTVARDALPRQPLPRKLSVNLIQAALEHDPGDLQRIIGSVLALSKTEQADLVRLLDRTELSNVISAATTVTGRLAFISRLRDIFADSKLRDGYREIDQLHPDVAGNLWLFGENWALARTEQGLTSVLEQHLHLLDDEAQLEHRLKAVRRPDGRLGRVDIVMFRSAGDERRSERLVIELKRPSVVVGRKELDQIKSYARAIVDDPQYKGVNCQWQFVLVTYDYDKSIERDIRQQGKEPGLADDQVEYQVWVRSWGEIFDTAERRLFFFKKQLQLEAREESLTRNLDAKLEQLVGGTAPATEVAVEQESDTTAAPEFTQ